MGISKITTLTALDTVADALNLNRWAFNGFTIPPCQSHLETGCGGAWQQSVGEQVTRDDFAQAIRSAEAKMEAYLNFSIIPRWHSDTISLLPTDRMILRPNVQTSLGYVLSVGVEKRELLGTYPVTRVDLDGDSFNEVATLDITQYATLDPNEIAVFYQGTDLEIRPIEIVDIGTTRKIQIPSYRIPKLDLIDRYCPDPLDSSDDNSYATDLDVYRIYNDTSEQITAYYDPTISCTTDCETGYANVCGFIRDGKLGFIAYPTIQHPDMLKVNYRSGWTGNGRKRDLDGVWVMPLAALTVSLLHPQKSTPCGEENGLISEWASDYSDMINPDLSRVVVRFMMENPLGITTKGAFYALQMMKDYRLWPK